MKTGKRKLYWDSTCLLAWLNGEGTDIWPASVVRGINDIVQEVEKNTTILFTSTLTRGEIFQGRLSDEQKVKIRAGNSTVTLDTKFNKKLEKIVGPDEFAEGTVSGVLEAVNIHETNRFTLYPSIGPRKISGTFETALRPRVKEALGNFVTVTGTLKYKGWASYPHGVIAEGIDIHEPEEQLPTLSEVKGAFAGSMGDLNSAEFIDRLRHEDW